MPKGRGRAVHADIRRWNHHATDASTLERVRDEVIRRAGPSPDDDCVDLGAGTGLLTLPLARIAAHVLAVDVSPAMIEVLGRRARREGLDNVETLARDLTTLRLPEQSADLVVSGHALHHLPHAQKKQLPARAYRWLRPGGRLVIADMMFGRGRNVDDREAMAAKVKALADRGPGGVWRVARNAARLGLHVGNGMPAPAGFWRQAAAEAGFCEIGCARLGREAGVLWSRVPH